MTTKELLETFGIKNPSLKLIKHPKVLQILAYCNQFDVTLYEHDFEIQEDVFLIFLDNINEIATLLKLLKRTDILLNLNFNPQEIARFYNLYDSEKLQYSEYTKILIDDEYLKYATKEWTEMKLLKENKVLSITNKEIKLIDNKEEVDSFLLNLISLQKAHDLGLLFEAISKLSE